VEARPNRSQRAGIVDLPICPTSGFSLDARWPEVSALMAPPRQFHSSLLAESLCRRVELRLSAIR
jgi:hypothetical protein